MRYMNTSSNYGSVSKFLHWLIFLAVLALLTVGTIMGQLPNSSLQKASLYNAHKLSGLTVLGLMLIRILWAFINTKPRLPNTVPHWQALTARSIQYLFYVVLLIMPISGWIMATAANHPPLLFGTPLPAPGIMPDKELTHTAGIVHFVTALTIVTLLILHIAAALKHHFINKDDVLRTMLPKKWGGKNE